MVGCTGMEGLHPTDGVHQSYRCVFNAQGAQRHQQPVKLFGVHGRKVAQVDHESARPGKSFSNEEQVGSADKEDIHRTWILFNQCRVAKEDVSHRIVGLRSGRHGRTRFQAGEKRERKSEGLNVFRKSQQGDRVDRFVGTELLCFAGQADAGQIIG